MSEVGYGTLLAHIARELDNVHIHIDVKVLQPGAGDARALVNRAIQIITNEEQRREPYAVKAVLLDAGNQDIMTAAATRAAQQGIDYLIWQSPDHEAVLLRHLEGCQQRRPPNSAASLAALRAEWPEYEKAMSAQRLGARITLDRIRQACGVETELRALLMNVGVL